jgi:phenylalanyl-tRNA synthetase alpha chain
MNELSPLKKAELAVNAKRPNDSLLKFEVSSKESIDRALAVTDLTREDAPLHAINIISNRVIEALKTSGFGSVRVIRANPIVSVEDNFDKLLFPYDNAGRASTYTRYVDEGHILRTHTSANVPEVFADFYKEHNGDIPDTVFVFIGLVYRRDVIDPRHLDVFHQMDIWTLQKNGERAPMKKDDLLRLVNLVFKAVVPDLKPVIYDAVHPYTLEGVEVYADLGNNSQLEILEAGLAHPEVLRNAGFDPEQYSGLASGFGLDRLVMALKSVPDVRYLRSNEPRIAAQMRNTEKFKEVSSMPPISRDMSYCIPETFTEEDINEEIKDAFGDKAFLVENVKIVSRTKYADLLPVAIERLGAVVGQDNVLVNITLRHPDVTLTKKEANALYDAVYPKLHKGSKGYL